MTKTIPERFAEIIEMLILAIEAQLVGAPLPNRVAASMAALVRSNLEKLNAGFANAVARALAGAPIPTPVTRRARAAMRAKAPAKPLAWPKRLRGWLPRWFAATPGRPDEPLPRPARQPVSRSSAPPRKHGGKALSSRVQPEPPAIQSAAIEPPVASTAADPISVGQTLPLGINRPPSAPGRPPSHPREAPEPPPKPKFSKKNGVRSQLSARPISSG